MDSLIQAFGIDIKLIVIQVINFTILAGVLTYFLYKPILKMLNEREEKIKKGVEDAEAAGVARNAAEGERKEIVAEAHQSAEEIGKRAEAHAKEVAAAAAAATEEETAHKLQLATARAEAIAEETRKNSEAEIAKLAVLAAEKILKEKAT